MTLTDKTAQGQTDSISFEFDLHHSPEKVWRALTDPVLLAQWLLPSSISSSSRGRRSRSRRSRIQVWDGTVNCRFVEIEPQRKLSYTWAVPFLETVVTFTLTPTP